MVATLRWLACLACAAALPTATSHAQVIVPDDEPTIQSALAVGAFVQVRPGTYEESLTIEGSARIEGLGGRPVIAPPLGKGIVARCSRAASGIVTLQDLDIIGGTIGLIVKKCRTDLLRVTIDGARKGAIVKGPSALISASSFINSTKGPGLVMTAISPSVFSSTFDGNSGGGAKIRNRSSAGTGGTAAIHDSTFNDNGKTGLWFVDKFDLDLFDCEASRNGGAGFMLKERNQTPDVRDNQADDNDTYGFDLRGSVPTEAQLLSNGNGASGNGILDFRIQ